MTVWLLNEDCMSALPRLSAEGLRAHACVTDPPYHLTSVVKRFGKEGSAPAQHGTDGAFSRASRGFMGKTWDGGDIAFRPETWAAVKSCLLPGAHLVAFGGTRGWHRMASAIEDAGFEIRDTIFWCYGTGFPKSKNIGRDLPEWDGWGTALKPAVEPVILARVPLDGTVAGNVLAHGCGGLNIDACRVGTTDKLGGGAETQTRSDQKGSEGWSRPWMSDAESQERHAATVRANVEKAQALGRWPANLIHDGSDEIEAAFAAFGSDKGAASPVRGDEPSAAIKSVYSARERVPGAFHGDSGTASRFFYSAKASKSDRAGSNHPTVKPTALMRWLVQLVTPPGGTVLDPFAGTGSTGLAADELGMNAVLVEREAAYALDIMRKTKAREVPACAAE